MCHTDDGLHENRLGLCHCSSARTLSFVQVKYVASRVILNDDAKSLEVWSSHMSASFFLMLSSFFAADSNKPQPGEKLVEPVLLTWLWLRNHSSSGCGELELTSLSWCPGYCSLVLLLHVDASNQHKCFHYVSFFHLWWFNTFPTYCFFKLLLQQQIWLLHEPNLSDICPALLWRKDYTEYMMPSPVAATEVIRFKRFHLFTMQMEQHSRTSTSLRVKRKKLAHTDTHRDRQPWTDWRLKPNQLSPRHRTDSIMTWLRRRSQQSAEVCTGHRATSRRCSFWLISASWVNLHHCSKLELGHLSSINLQVDSVGSQSCVCFVSSSWIQHHVTSHIL